MVRRVLGSFVVLLFVVLATTAVGCQTLLLRAIASIDVYDSGTLGDPRRAARTFVFGDP